MEIKNKKVLFIRMLGYLWFVLLFVDVIFLNKKYISDSILGTALSGMVASRCTEYKRDSYNESTLKKILSILIYVLLGILLYWFW